MSQEIPLALAVDRYSKLKLRPTVAVVTTEERTEFFRSDIRTSLSLKIHPEISPLLFSLDGLKTVEEWMEYEELKESNLTSILELFSLLKRECILIEVDRIYPESYLRHKRVYAFLENYASSTSQVIQAFDRLSSSRVLIIGLGAVGTWVAQSLMMSGVRNFTLVDPDLVELSNLHRQIGFGYRDVGCPKVDAFRDYLWTKDQALDIEIIKDVLDEGFFDRHPVAVDLIINCADHPTVDETSRIVGDYAMTHGIAHCVGGGYNLHQTLVGQIIIPGETACVECFRLELEELNVIDTSNITRLDNPKRKIGSFPPLSALSASITSNEAFKFLSGIGHYCMANNRTEFTLREMNFMTIPFKRRQDCIYCGTEGKYYQLPGDTNP